MMHDSRRLFYAKLTALARLALEMLTHLYKASEWIFKILIVGWILKFRKPKMLRNAVTKMSILFIYDENVDYFIFINMVYYTR